MSVTRYLAGMFLALLVMVSGQAEAQMCAATCLDVETLGAATVYDQETGVSTMYDQCVYTDCACTVEDADADPVWICCQESTQHGWGSFGDGSCVSYSAGEVIVSGIGDSVPAPIPEPDDLSWSLLDWLGDLLREMPEHSEHGGIILVDIWPEDHPREGRPTLAEVADFFEDLGMFDTEDGADDPTPTLEDPSERDGFIEKNPLGTEYRVDWSVEPDLSPESSPCVVEVIDQPVSVVDEDGSQAAYANGCTVTHCPGVEPVTECCAKESWAGTMTCQVVAPTSEVIPYQTAPSSLDDILDWLEGLEDADGVPSGYEGPWKFYLYTSATDGR